jgi:hypothetical protein
MGLPALKRALKALLRKQPTPDEFRTIIRELENAHPRAVAIMGATAVEDALKGLIIKHFTPAVLPSELDDLFGPTKPLSSFSAKINIAHAMGLFGPKTKADLDLLRDIRNAFAHARISISFKTPEIAELCDYFICASPTFRSARDTFISAAENLFIHLWNRQFGTSFGSSRLD